MLKSRSTNGCLRGKKESSVGQSSKRPRIPLLPGVESPCTEVSHLNSLNSFCLDRGFAFSGEAGNDRILTDSLMDRLQAAFKRQLLPKELADERINEETSNGSTLGEQTQSQEDKGNGLLGLLGIGKATKDKDLKKLEEETLQKGKIQKIEELPIMENMSDFTSSHITGELISHQTLTDSKIIENLGGPGSIEREKPNVFGLRHSNDMPSPKDNESSSKEGSSFPTDR